MSHRGDLFDQGIDDEPVRPGMGWAHLAFAVAFVLGILIAAGTGNSSNCASLSDNAARLACFDTAAHARPAKGADVPEPYGESHDHVGPLGR